MKMDWLVKHKRVGSKPSNVSTTGETSSNNNKTQQKSPSDVKTNFAPPLNGSNGSKSTSISPFVQDGLSTSVPKCHHLAVRPLHTFSTKHDEVIHCIAYDFYGKRIATCSSDQKIKVWKIDNRGLFVLSADWKAHRGSIWRVEWAHPQFGSVLASCSFDRCVSIWEEADSGQGDLAEWRKVAEIVDARDSVTDIKFSPQQQGLRLATCSSDGRVRVYHALDPLNLCHWSLVAEFVAFPDGNNCITWNTSMLDPPALAVGGMCSSRHAEIKEQQQQQQQQHEGSALFQQQQQQQQQIQHQEADKKEKEGGGGNTKRQAHLPAIKSEEDGGVGGCEVKVWREVQKASGAEWELLHTLPGHTDEVLDVSWAPNLGRKYNLLASSSRDGTVRIWRLPTYHSTKFEPQQVAVLRHDHGAVWKVEWNVTGTVLASCGDDVVCFWKANYKGDWCLLFVTSEESGTYRQSQNAQAEYNNNATKSANASNSGSSGALTKKSHTVTKDKPEGENGHSFHTSALPAGRRKSISLVPSEQQQQQQQQRQQLKGNNGYAFGGVEWDESEKRNDRGWEEEEDEISAAFVRNREKDQQQKQQQKQKQQQQHSGKERSMVASSSSSRSMTKADIAPSSSGGFRMPSLLSIPPTDGHLKKDDEDPVSPRRKSFMLF